MKKKVVEPLTSEQWRSIIDEYVCLRDLERSRFMEEMRRLLEDLRRDSATLYTAAILREIQAPVDELKLSDFGASGIRRRLTANGHTARHLRFTRNHLNNLEEQVVMDSWSLRTQAWWLDVAAGDVAVCIDLYLARREQLRRHGRGRAPSVGLDFLIAGTLDCKPSEIADRLANAKIMPESESDHDDPAAQWKQHLKRARTRYRKRGPH